MRHPSAGNNHTNNPKGGGKRGGNKRIALERREARRQRALERQEARAKRSPIEQLYVLDDRPGASQREKARLRKQVKRKRRK